MKTNLLMALVVTTLFSCGTEKSELPGYDGVKNVTLTIKGVESVASRASEAAGTAHETPVSDFKVYFIGSAGSVIETRTVTAPDGSQDQYVFDKVSGLATKMYIVANTTLTNTTLTGLTLADLKNNVLEIANYQNGIDNVILADVDASPITKKSGEDGKYEATVTIAPVVSRLEIAQLQAVSANDAGLSDIANFTVANIYVNGYTPNMPLVGEATGSIPGTTDNFETTDLKDLNINIASTNKVAKPYPNWHVWAYQLFPGAAPTMVIQFSSITFENGITLTDQNTPAEELCITVKGFTPSTFAAARIYNVANIQFSSKNIGRPYEVTKNISAIFNVAPWKIMPTTVTVL